MDVGLYDHVGEVSGVALQPQGHFVERGALGQDCLRPVQQAVTFGAEPVVVELAGRRRRVGVNVNPARLGELLHPLAELSIGRERLIERLAQLQQLVRVERSEGQRLV